MAKHATLESIKRERGSSPEARAAYAAAKYAFELGERVRELR
jgi:hypothetical protein